MVAINKILSLFLIGIISVMMLHDAVPHEHHDLNYIKNDIAAHNHNHGHDHKHSDKEDSKNDNNNLIDFFAIDHFHAFHSHENAKVSKTGIKLVSKKAQKKFTLYKMKNPVFSFYINKITPGSIYKKSYYKPPLILSNSLRAPPYFA